MAVVAHHQRMALQLAYGAQVRFAARIIAQHPTDVREPEAAARAIRIALRVINISVMCAVTGAPQERAVLQRHSAEQKISELERRTRLVGGMREQPMIATSDR